MRILRLMGCDSRQYGSMERYLVRVCEAAADAGHQVLIAYDDTPASSAFCEAVVQAGGRVVALGMTGSRIRFLRRLHRLVREERIDVLHAYFTPACHYAMVYAWATGLRARLRTSANMPLTMRLATEGLGALRGPSFALTQRLASVFPRRILALSSPMREEIVGLGVPARKVALVAGGVDERRFRPPTAEQRRAAREAFGLGDAFVVGVTARMVPVKGLDCLLRAAVRVRDDVRFVLAGEGPLRAELEALARDLGLGERVSFPGRLQDVRELLAAVDVVALPTRSEGLSNSVMEAMACALPVVATDIPANREVLDDEANGLLVPVDDADALAAAIDALAADPGLCGRLGTEGRRRIEERYNVGRRIAEEFAQYEELSR